MATISTLSAAGDTGYNTEVATWTKTVTANNGDVVEGLKVRKGWVIYDVTVKFAGTASATVTVGDAGDADRFVSSTSTAADGMVRLNNAAGVGYEYTADDTIDLTIGGANVAAKDYTIQVIFARTFE